MATTPTLLMSVLHLSTGHVLAAFSAGPAQPTAQDVTGGAYLAVRFPATNDLLTVTPDLLTMVSVPLDEDVLDRPQHFRVVDGVPPLSYVGTPAALPAGLGAPPATPCLSLWQVGDELEVVTEVLDSSGNLGADKPPGAQYRIVACKDRVLYFDGP